MVTMMKVITEVQVVDKVQCTCNGADYENSHDGAEDNCDGKHSSSCHIQHKAWLQVVIRTDDADDDTDHGDDENDKHDDDNYDDDDSNGDGNDAVMMMMMVAITTKTTMLITRVMTVSYTHLTLPTNHRV